MNVDITVGNQFGQYGLVFKKRNHDLIFDGKYTDYCGVVGCGLSVMGYELWVMSCGL
ncbi:hypothetical protein [Flavobacterium sp.]|uniref:hypothetical protein n=1 Tax=Flavobacterium sp. TaxID=239 RepID=UPI002B4B5015|nr:hypothetical protein [Flavobacterium sp.]HLF51201.1 hypothetical protein [Flavobacterium sp.]